MLNHFVILVKQICARFKQILKEKTKKNTFSVKVKTLDLKFCLAIIDFRQDRIKSQRKTGSEKSQSKAKKILGGNHKSNF